MENKQTLGERIRLLLGRRFSVCRENIGADARLAKKGMVFETEVYTVESVGHLCVLRMKAMLGLMQMETVVLAPTQKDLPLLNWDRVKAFGSETQIVEMYDTQLSPWPEKAQEACAGIAARDADLPDHAASGAHWYDSFLYPCSYHKRGKKLSARLDAAALDYAALLTEELASAPLCDAAAKQEKVRRFAETLYEQGVEP